MLTFFSSSNSSHFCNRPSNLHILCYESVIYTPTTTSTYEEQFDNTFTSVSGRDIFRMLIFLTIVIVDSFIDLINEVAFCLLVVWQCLLKAIRSST